MFDVFHKLSLKLKVTLFTLLLFLLAISLLTLYFSKNLRTELEVSLSDHQFSEVNFVAERIENAIKIRIDSLSVLATAITPEMLTSPTQLSNFLEKRKAIYRLFTLGTIVIAKDGKGIVDFPKVEGRGSADYSEREFYRLIMSTTKPALSKPSLGRFVKDPRLVIAVPIFGKDQKIIGVLAGIVSLGDGSLLSNLDNNSEANASDYLIMSPRDKIFVAATDKSLTLKPLPPLGTDAMLDRYLSGHEGSGISVSARGEEMLSSAKHLTSADWVVVAALPTSKAFSLINHIRNNSIIAAGIITLFTLPLLWLFLRHELSPLQRSVSRIKNFSREKGMEQLPLEGSPEIQQLLTSFNQLQVEIKQNEVALQENEALYRNMFENNTAMKLLVDPSSGLIVDANPAAVSFYGWPITQLKAMSIFQISTQPEEDQRLSMQAEEGPDRHLSLARHRLASGEIRDVEVHAARVNFRGNELLYSIVTDVTERELALSRERLRGEILESLAHGKSISEILHSIVELVEREQPDTYCAIMEVDEAGKHLLVSAAPSLPADYKKAVDGLEIGSKKCACGISAHNLTRTILNDLQAHPFFPEFKNMALRNQIHSCWAEPLIDSTGKLLGTFTVYLKETSEPNASQIKLLEQMSKLASIALERKLDEGSLRLSDTVIKNSPNAVIITNPDNLIVSVNPAFTQITQYTAKDVLGKNPSLLGSKKQSPNFYQELWAALLETGSWSGEIINNRKSGEAYIQATDLRVVYDDQGKVEHYISIFSDITEKKKLDDIIHEQALYDPLTGLPNRRYFYDHLAKELKRTERTKMPLAIMFIDLDHFKEVNDSLGHETGDFLLQDAAKRITQCIRETDTIARLGGDEFTIILPGLADKERLEVIAQNIIQTMSSPFKIGNSTVYVTASIGITIYPNDAEDLSALLKNADQAMYVAKNRGRNQFSYFTQSMQVAAQMRLKLSNELRTAVEAEQFEVYYQPIIELATGHVSKAEALIRWNHPTLGMVSPATFIPLAEEIGLINTIGDWVFRQSALQALTWNLNKGPHLQSIQISVNKSPRQFVAGKSNLDIVEWLQQLALPPACIVMEITEGLLMDDRSEVQETLLGYRDAGIQVSLDDFGTGYSAMSYLQRFDIDYIKIDQSFVRNMVNTHGDQVIVEAIVVMAHKLGMKVIAEGVETEQQRQILVAAGCDFAQGYLFARPMPAAQFNKFLEDQLRNI